MTLMFLTLLIASGIAALFGGAIPGTVFAVLALSVVVGAAVDFVAAAVRLALRRRAAEEMKRKLAKAVGSGGFGTYL